MKDTAVGGLSRVAGAVWAPPARCSLGPSGPRDETADPAPSSESLGTRPRPGTPRLQGRGGRGKVGSGPGCPPGPGRAAPAARAHPALDGRPVFRSGLPAPGRQASWLAFARSLCLSLPHPVALQRKQPSLKFIVDVVTKSWVPGSECSVCSRGGERRGSGRAGPRLGPLCPPPPPPWSPQAEPALVCTREPPAARPGPPSRAPPSSPQSPSRFTRTGPRHAPRRVFSPSGCRARREEPWTGSA